MDLNAPHLRYRNQTPRERTWTIHLIAAEKVIKGAIVILIAFKLLSLLGQDVHAWGSDFVNRHSIIEGNRYIHELLEKLVGVGDRQLVGFSVIAFLYAALLYVEAIGLWLQKRWAEYLTAIASTLLIPVEIYEIYERFTWVRIIILAINIFVVWYLTNRLRDEKVDVEETFDEQQPNVK